MQRYNKKVAPTKSGQLTYIKYKENLDPFLVYRLLYPGYELWNEMGIYQRDLTSYKETPLLENRDFGKQCMNCHSFTLNSPATMMLHIRGKQGGTLIRRNGQTEKVNLKPERYKNPWR